MSESKLWEGWVKHFGKAMRRLHFKQTWLGYMNDLISYGDFKIRCFEIVNAVREERGNDPYSREKFDDAWQYRILAHDNYRIAYNELLCVVLGWW